MKTTQPLNKKKPLRSIIKSDLKMNKALYFMVLPVLAFYFIFCYIPMAGVIISFQDYHPALGILKSPWVGLTNYIDFFSSNYFVRLLFNTLRISVCSLILGFPAPIILALLINELKSKRYAKVVQTATYMPHFISLVIVVSLIKTFTDQGSIFELIYEKITGESISLLMLPKAFVPIYVISNIWQGCGWDSILYIAALTAVDPQLYEACKMDGGGKVRQLISVTLPAIAPTIITMLILRIGNILSVGYEKIILMYNQLTYSTADVISTFVYRKGLEEMNWSYSTAVGVFNSVINVIFLTAANLISRKVSETSLW